MLLIPTLACAAAVPGESAIKAAAHALATYRTDVVDVLRTMVSFNTVANPAVPFETNPQHIGFKRHLAQQAQRLGFDFVDYGHVLVIGMGTGTDRLGIITHGDVQPAEPDKWARSPFELDQTSEPGRLIGRGAEDDKGPIATALYAMKAISDLKLPLSKRVELYVYMAEESDWDPLVSFLKTHVPPQLNITLDAEYPVVTAEKGYGTVSVTLQNREATVAPGQPTLSAFTGGFFGSQIPEDASVTILDATAALQRRIVERASTQRGMHYQYQWQGSTLRISARGVSAHSSKPEDGVNAISMLADALAVQPWPATAAGGIVNFLNDLVGTGFLGAKFGAIAYHDSFMGPMTFAPTVIKQTDIGIELNINLRRPQGKSTAQLTNEINDALTRWQARGTPLSNVKISISEPWVRSDAPQVGTLLSVFSHFTGIKGAKPVAIGGATNSRLFPNAVSFGPAMPGKVYTGHSEHEFITTEQLLLNLQMYTAVIVELAK